MIWLFAVKTIKGSFVGLTVKDLRVVLYEVMSLTRVMLLNVFVPTVEFPISNQR